MKPYLFNNSVLTADVLLLKHHKLDRLVLCPSLVCWNERMEPEAKPSINWAISSWTPTFSPELLVRSSDIPEPPGQEFWARPPGATQERPRPSPTWWDQTPHVALESQVCCPGAGCWISGSPEVTGPHPHLDKCSTTVGNQVEQNKSDLEGTIKITFDVPFLSSSKIRFNDCFNAHLPSLIHHQSSWSVQTILR